MSKPNIEQPPWRMAKWSFIILVIGFVFCLLTGQFNCDKNPANHQAKSQLRLGLQEITYDHLKKGDYKIVEKLSADRYFLKDTMTNKLLIVREIQPAAVARDMVHKPPPAKN